MKILFVMDQRVDRGSIQAIANYVRAGDEMGQTIALYGREDPSFPGVRRSTDVPSFDYVVFVIESWRKWMTGLRMPRLMDGVPRGRRAILDADGMYNQVIAVDGYDRNHPDEGIRAEWIAHYRLVADKILQPTLEPLEPGVWPVPFFGYDPGSLVNEKTSPPKRFDILHVGHNWWRWREVSNALLPAIERIRGQVGDICFLGSWWDAPPAGAAHLNLELAFEVDYPWFQKLGIQVQPPVPYTEVIPVMSASRVNIMTQRPLFRRLKILTSKFFEIFTADTIPLVMVDGDQAESVYGPAGRDLALYGNGMGIEDRLLDALQNPRRYREIVQKVRSHLAVHHSYRKRVEDLVKALRA